MRKQLVACLVVLVAVAVGGCRNHGEVEEKATIVKTAVPTNVMNAFQKDHPAADISKVEKETYRDGTVHYEFKFWENGKKMEVEYNKDGEALEKH